MPADLHLFAGIAAWRKISIDCSVGVTESTDGCRISSGRGAMRATTSLGRKRNMLSTTSNGNSMNEPAGRPPRISGGIGTMSKRETRSDRPSASARRPLSSSASKRAQASGDACWRRNLVSPSPQPPLLMQAAMRASTAEV